MEAILKRILERSVEGRTGDEWRPSIDALRTAWPGLVGERLADVTEPRSIDWESGDIVVAAADATWRRELERHKGPLLDRIVRILPWELERLEFVTGSFEPGGDTPAEAVRASERPVDTPEDRTTPDRRIDLPDDLEASLDSLGDGAASSARRILEHLRAEHSDGD